jgi:hypothetical protein
LNILGDDTLVIDDEQEKAWIERKVYHLILNGTETIGIGGENYYSIALPLQSTPYGVGSKCTHFKYNNVASASMLHGDFKLASSGTTIYFKSNLADNNAFKAFISEKSNNGTPVIVDYQLAVPVIEEIPYLIAKTFDRYTGISTDSPMQPSIKAEVKILGNGNTVNFVELGVNDNMEITLTTPNTRTLESTISFNENGEVIATA